MRIPRELTITMNLANWITIFRILLVPCFVILLLYGKEFAALGVFCVAGITDGIDGYIARSMGLKTKLGSYLDPLADKLLLVSSFVVFSIKYPKIVPVWLTILVLSRDLLIIIGVVILQFVIASPKIEPSFLGKTTTAVQILMIFFSLLLGTINADALPVVIGFFIGLTALFTIVSGLQYVLIGTRQINGG